MKIIGISQDEQKEVFSTLSGNFFLLFECGQKNKQASKQASKQNQEKTNFFVIIICFNLIFFRTFVPWKRKIC